MLRTLAVKKNENGENDFHQFCEHARRGRCQPGVCQGPGGKEDQQKGWQVVLQTIRYTNLQHEQVFKWSRYFFISRYLSDLFYMAPIYHQAFTKLDKLLVVDSTDLTIVSDIKVPVTGVKKS